MTDRGPGRTSGRRFRAPRCSGCQLFPEICVCDLLPTIDLKTEVLLILHKGEAHKPTNTGRLGCRMLSNHQQVLWSSRVHPPVPEPRWPAPDRGLLLFPGDGAVPLEDLRGDAGGYTLIVPDGTWSEVQRIVHGTPALRPYRRCALPEGVAARNSPRRETRAGGMSTLDAISYALAALEGEEAVAPLDAAFARWFEAAMALRGTPLRPERNLAALRAERADRLGLSATTQAGAQPSETTSAVDQSTQTV